MVIVVLVCLPGGDEPVGSDADADVDPDGGIEGATELCAGADADDDLDDPAPDLSDEPLAEEQPAASTVVAASIAAAALSLTRKSGCLEGLASARGLRWP